MDHRRRPHLPRLRHPRHTPRTTTAGVNATDELADIRSLNALAETWHTAPDGSRRFVPNFDPRSGGTSSRVLVLMQSPGPQTIAAVHAAICSEANPGPTAAALRSTQPESDDRDALFIRARLSAALAGLTDKQREAVLLRYLGERTIPEVAQQLGISSGTAGTRVRDGILALSHALTPRTPTP
ncbi:sigma-70 family RNA polymerase sigma factor [Curtobacterium sp. 22159]|uniref:sigma-70 family RNA polymerase sigma factor n=1 Tax=Curtobacterium sp. 22159 TaxID=3453882 RepID=UPI003F837A57